MELVTQLICREIKRERLIKRIGELKQMVDQYMMYYNESRKQWNLKKDNSD